MYLSGATAGKGTACAGTFKNESIILTDHSQEAVDRVVKNIEREGCNIVGSACDITNINDIDKLTYFFLQVRDL